MDGFEDLLRRIRTDDPFRSSVAADPGVVVRGFGLDEVEVGRLADAVLLDSRLDPVSRRTRRAAFFQLLIEQRSDRTEETSAAASTGAAEIALVSPPRRPGR